MGARVAERRPGPGLNKRAARGWGADPPRPGEGRRREEEDDGNGRGFRLHPAGFLLTLLLLRGEARRGFSRLDRPRDRCGWDCGSWVTSTGPE
jgi:hypothetical protein